MAKKYFFIMYLWIFYKKWKKEESFAVASYVKLVKFFLKVFFWSSPSSSSFFDNSTTVEEEEDDNIGLNFGRYKVL